MSVIFSDARIIDGCGDVQARGFVVIEKNRIEEVGRGSGPSKKNGHEVIDLDEGAFFVTPGGRSSAFHAVMEWGTRWPRAIRPEPWATKSGLSPVGSPCSDRISLISAIT